MVRCGVHVRFEALQGREDGAGPPDEDAGIPIVPACLDVLPRYVRARFLAKTLDLEDRCSGAVENCCAAFDIAERLRGIRGSNAKRDDSLVIGCDKFGSLRDAL